MDEIKNAYGSPPSSYSDRGSSGRYVSNERKVTTDFYNPDAPDFKTGKQVMQEVEAKHGGELSKRVSKLTVTSSGPDLSAAQCLYLASLLERRGLKGPYVVHNVGTFGPFVSYNFKNDIGSFCPICKEDHQGYTFTYKVKVGSYGGWKCWKNDMWETQYDFGQYEVLY